MRLFHVPATHSPLRARFPQIDLSVARARVATLHARLSRWSAEGCAQRRHAGRSWCDFEREIGHDITGSPCRDF